MASERRTGIPSPRMNTFSQDLRFAVRTARRTPGVTVTIVASLALGLAACTLMLCVAYGFLLRPLPFRHPEELAAVMARRPGEPASPSDDRMSQADFLDLQRQTRTFSEMGAYFENLGLTVIGGGGKDGGAGEPERVTAAIVSARLFPLLGVKPMLGRQIRPEEDRRGTEPAVLLGHALWRRRFGGDPRIVGRTITANGELYQVIGVMPPGFAFPDHNEAWVPLGIQSPPPSLARSLHRYRVLGRLRPGATLDAAGRETAEIARRMAALDAADPADRTGTGLRLDVIPVRQALLAGGGENLRHSVLALLTAVLAVLLIACVNVTSLLLARVLERRGEIALRAALGARPAQIVRQLVTESLVLALAAAAVGLPLGAASARLVERLLPPLPYGITLAAAPQPLVAAFALALLAGLACGVVPALQARRPDLGRMLVRGGMLSGGGRRQGRLHAGLVVAEVALSTVLLVTAFLEMRTFAALRSAGTGVVEARLLTVWMQLSGDRYHLSEARGRAVQELASRVAGTPGIEAAAGANFVPLGIDNGSQVRIEEAEGAAAGGARMAHCLSVTSGLFRSLGTPLLAGRDLTSEEGGSASAVAVVSSSLASSLWPDGHALGRRLRISGFTVDGWLTVVGVAGDLKTHDPRAPAEPLIFVAAPYNPFRPAALLVRTDLPRAAALTTVRRAVHSADPNLAFFGDATMEEVHADRLHVDRLASGALALFAATALFLAAVGTYGVLAVTVVRRRREMAIRLALGAKRGALVRRLIGGGVALTLAGLALGLAAGLAVAYALARQLFGIAPTDPVTYGGVSILLLDVAFIACWLPARRVLDVQPAEALRRE